MGGFGPAFVKNYEAEALIGALNSCAFTSALCVFVIILKQNGVTTGKPPVERFEQRWLHMVKLYMQTLHQDCRTISQNWSKDM